MYAQVQNWNKITYSIVTLYKTTEKKGIFTLKRRDIKKRTVIRILFSSKTKCIPFFKKKHTIDGLYVKMRCKHEDLNGGETVRLPLLSAASSDAAVLWWHCSRDRFHGKIIPATHYNTGNEIWRWFWYWNLFRQL